MKITASNKEFEIGVKRLYLPFKAEIECPNCKKTLEHDFERDYLMYPKLDEPYEITFFCQCCDLDIVKKVKLHVGIEAVVEQEKKEEETYKEGNPIITRPVGDIFQIKGKSIKVVESENGLSCNSCCMVGELAEYCDNPNNCDPGACLKECREDGKEVHFVVVSAENVTITKNLDFGQAINLAKMGYRIKRAGWNGTNMFAYYVEGGTFPAKSAAIKGVFENDMVPYRPYLALKTAQNDIAMWAPSGSDSIATDWEVVE